MGNKQSYDVQQSKKNPNPDASPSGKVHRVHDATHTDVISIQNENSPSSPARSSITSSIHISEVAVDVAPQPSLASLAESPDPEAKSVFTTEAEYEVQARVELVTDDKPIVEVPVAKLFRVKPLPECDLEKEPTESCYA
ncbi:unnamed protein product, partial [Mesorhabditis spiculigera]